MAHVLVIDDDDGIRESLRIMLEDAGHTVTDAANPDQGLTLLRSASRPYVVLLDLVMPNSDPDALLREVRPDPSLARHCYVAVLATPPRGFSADVQQLLADVCLGVVLKPFELDVLMAAVERADQQLANDGALQDQQDDAGGSANAAGMAGAR
ncbi:MAG: response regulator [Ktedonobacterales bacterium]